MPMLFPSVYWKSYRAQTNQNFKMLFQLIVQHLHVKTKKNNLTQNFQATIPVPGQEEEKL